MTTKFENMFKDLKIPVKDMSELLGVSQQMIYYWRSYGIRNWRTAGRIAKQLKCKPEEIIGDA